VDEQEFRFFLIKNHSGIHSHCHPSEPEVFSDETNSGSDVRMGELEAKTTLAVHGEHISATYKDLFTFFN